MRRGVPILGVGLSAAVLIGLGCSRGTACPEGKVCLRYMAWGNPQQLQVERDFVALFNRENPDLYVRLVTVPGSSYGQKMTTMLVSRTAPDVMRVDHYVFPAMQKKGFFADMTGLAADDPSFRASDFYPTALEEGTVDGRLYGMNVLYGGILIYYNKTMFRLAGLEDPYELWRKGEWTWERFRASAKALSTQENGRPKTFGTTAPSFPTNVPLLRAFGGELLSEDLSRSVVASEGTIRAYQFLADLVWKDHVAPTPSQGANSAFAFESGKLGMTFDWMGMTPRFRSAIRDFEWDVCPVPSGPKGGATIVKGNQLVIAAASRNPNAAWRFVRFLTGPEVERKLYAEIRRSFPTRRAVAESKDFLDTEQAPFNTRAFVDSIETARPLPISDRWAQWTQILNSNTDDLMAGRERDAGVVLRRAQVEIDKALSEPEGF
ncbi:sugar ABC transporter substrate-binding protein [bacterium]|nr:MAG: sugar ABC transporter substrate-binding protein [bacterium]